MIVALFAVQIIPGVISEVIIEAVEGDVEEVFQELAMKLVKQDPTIAWSRNDVVPADRPFAETSPCPAHRYPADSREGTFFMHCLPMICGRNQ